MPAEESVRQDLFGDLWAIWDLLLAVVEAQLSIVETIRLVVNHDRGRSGRWDPGVENLLKPAGDLILKAMSKLQRLYRRVWQVILTHQYLV
jgi:hypothetical protein